MWPSLEHLCVTLRDLYKAPTNLGLVQDVLIQLVKHNQSPDHFSSPILSWAAMFSVNTASGLGTWKSAHNFNTTIISGCCPDGNYRL